jgi:ATP-dependent RNA helicase DBP3
MTTAAADADKAARKAKKEAKRKRKAADAEAAAHAAGGLAAGAAAAANTDDKAARKAAKKAKKAAKAAAQAAAQSLAAGNSAMAAAAEARDKSAAAAPAPATSPSTRPRPAVGDAAAAAAGPPLVFPPYAPHPEVLAMYEADVAAWRDERRVAVLGADGPGARPCTAFHHARFAAALAAATADFAAPSPVQAQAWPLLLAGRDVIGIAATGSGKTLAFGLPALAHAAAQKVEKGAPRGPRVLVLAPTRELACQIAEVLEAAGARAGQAVALAHGGVPKGPQVAALRAGAAAVVGTPGRLQDLATPSSHHPPALRLGAVSFLVLDEADRMLDLGFEPAVRALAGGTRADRQTAMFSATWPAAVRALASDFLASPARVTVGSADLAASHSVAQTVEVIDPAARDGRLISLLGELKTKGLAEKVIVFVLYKKEAPRVEALLQRKGWAAAAVHGDAAQAARTAAVDAFRAGKVRILVATDVAARGLDIPAVSAVVNYSFPLTTEDYVHRIGRTGRAGATGVAHTFFSAASDRPRAGELINVLREAGQPVPAALLKFGTTVKRKESKLYGAHYREIEEGAKTTATKVTFDSDDE